MKKFNKLNPIIKNTMKMFAIQPGMPEKEIKDIEPTNEALSLLPLNSGPVVRSIFHAYMKRKECLAHLQIGMCQSLKSLLLQSVPDEHAKNGLRIYSCGPEAVGDDVNADQSLHLEEKALLGKLKDTDIEKLTKSERYIPKDFWGYEHMLRNFLQLIIFLGGENCHTTRALRQVLDHCNRHQALYRKYERDNQYFYVSLCEEINRRVQMFLTSCTEGKAEELAYRQIEQVFCSQASVDPQTGSQPAQQQSSKPTWQRKPRRRTRTTNLETRTIQPARAWRIRV